MSTTKAAKMTSLLESCSGFAEAVKLFRSAVQAQFADDTEGDPQELTALLAHLYDAEEAAQTLDDNCA